MTSINNIIQVKVETYIPRIPRGKSTTIVCGVNNYHLLPVVGNVR